MHVYHVNDSEFREYGQVLEKYDFSEFSENLNRDNIPKYGFYYVSSNGDLEKCKVKNELQSREFGGIPIQVGFVKGRSKVVNCLEYHKSSELNIALDDVVLVLGKQTEIKNGIYDTKQCKAFLLPAGTGVELYGTTLHYAPMAVSDDGYRVVCVLPLGTNREKPEFIPETVQDKMCAGCNKWIMAHPYSEEARNGAYAGLDGHKIIADILEF